MITGLISKSEAVKRTAFMIFILGALASIAAMTTGEGAEEIVEKINGVTENYIESHKTAETFALLSYILVAFLYLDFEPSTKQKTFFKYYCNCDISICICSTVFWQTDRNNWWRNKTHRNKKRKQYSCDENNNDEKIKTTNI